MNWNTIKTCLPLGALLLLSGCIDDNYDLSDIDTTSELRITDLTLPLNLDAINLGDIITIDEDSKIKIITLDGQEVYAVTESGDFSSDPIKVHVFTAPAPNIKDTEAVFNLLSSDQANRRKNIQVSYSYQLHSFSPQEIRFETYNVEESIVDIFSAKIDPLDIILDLSAKGLGDNATLKFKNLTFNFIKGLTLQNIPSGYSYDPATGRLVISELECPNHMAKIQLTATEINLKQAGVVFANNSFNYNSKVQLESGELDYTLDIDPTNLQTPSTEVVFDVKTTVGELVAQSFCGKLRYDISGDNLSITPVDLSDVPDFLSQSETNITLANPQIYLSINNPLSEYGLSVQTGLQLVAVRPDSRKDFNLDDGQNIKITAASGAGPYNYVLSPSMPSNPIAEYAKDLQHVGFSSLSEILSGAGIPQEIEINIVDPMMPEQEVTDFRLSDELPAVKGSYEFLAPLALKTGDNAAVIVYTDTEDGWNDEDIDKMIISKLQIDADITSTVPLSADVTIHPIDVDGNRISNVTIEGAHLDANAVDQHLTVVTSGEITHLDGVRFEATVRPASETALSPNQTISLKNIKVKVSGSYTTDF